MLAVTRCQHPGTSLHVSHGDQCLLRNRRYVKESILLRRLKSSSLEDHLIVKFTCSICALRSTQAYPQPELLRLQTYIQGVFSCARTHCPFHQAHFEAIYHRSLAVCKSASSASKAERPPKLSRNKALRKFRQKTWRRVISWKDYLGQVLC